VTPWPRPEQKEGEAGGAEPEAEPEPEDHSISTPTTLASSPRRSSSLVLVSPRLGSRNEGTKQDKKWATPRPSPRMMRGLRCRLRRQGQARARAQARSRSLTLTALRRGPERTGRGGLPRRPWSWGWDLRGGRGDGGFRGGRGRGEGPSRGRGDRPAEQPEERLSTRATPQPSQPGVVDVLSKPYRTQSFRWYTNSGSLA